MDLLKDFSKPINVGVRRRTGEVKEKWIKINYDYILKYYKSCKIQGHDEQQCYVLHSNLYPKVPPKDTKVEDAGNNKEGEGKDKQQPVGEGNGKAQKGRRNNNKAGNDDKGKQTWDRRGLIKQAQGVVTTNTFKALEHKDGKAIMEKDKIKENRANKTTTKAWVVDNLKGNKDKEV